MKKPKVAIDDWTIEVKGRGKEHVYVMKDSNEKRKISLEMFEEYGMMKFPKELYNLIRQDLRNANTYDRFVDKFYDYYEECYE